MANSIAEQHVALQSTEEQAPTTAKPVAPIRQEANLLLPGLLFYSLLWVLPILLKLAGCTRVATWSWWQATALLWVPWLVVAVLGVVGVLKLQGDT